MTAKIVRFPRLYDRRRAWFERNGRVDHLRLVTLADCPALLVVGTAETVSAQLAEIAARVAGRCPS